MKAGGTTRRPLVLQTDRGVILFQTEDDRPLTVHSPPSTVCTGGAIMLDINIIREQPEVVRKAMRDRQLDDLPVDAILQLDEKRRGRLTEVEKMKAERNAVSKEIGQTKDAASRQAKIEAMRAVGDKIGALDKEVAEVEAQLNALTATIPNIPDVRTPSAKMKARTWSANGWRSCRNSISSQSRTGTWARRLASSTSSAASRSPVRASMCSAAPGHASSGR